MYFFRYHNETELCFRKSKPLNPELIYLNQNSNAETLSLFPQLQSYMPVYRATSNALFDDQFLNELVNSKPMQRLKNIGFLGAIDYALYSTGIENHRRRHNRFDHSIGVATLAVEYSNIRELSLNEKRILAAAGLLHDIGHGPLSHTLEPVFKREFGISHHQSGTDIIYGRSEFGNEIASIFKQFQVDLDEVVAMVEGVHTGDHAFLFASPINLDTIEGITRSRSFFARSSAPLLALDIVKEIANSNSLPTDMLDKFWALKHEVYNVFIHHKIGLIYDGLAQAYMMANIERFQVSQFLFTENQLRIHSPELFHIFSWAQKSLERLRYRVHPSLFEYQVCAHKRQFEVNQNIELKTDDDLKRRYTQKKSKRSIVIGSLVNSIQG